MTFWDHLDELRKALFMPLIVLTVATIGAFVAKEVLFDVTLAANSKDFITYRLMPGYSAGGGNWLELVSTELPAQLLAHMKISFFAGLVTAIPFLLYSLFRYVSPGLYNNERRVLARVVTFAFIAFLAGVAVNYFIIFPFSLRFLANYTVSEQVRNMITLGSYIGTLTTLSLLMGIFFELPVMSWLLSRLGLLKGAAMAKYRRHAWAAILVISAVITPTTDIFTLLAVSLPIMLLYELSIIIARNSERSKKTAQKNKLNSTMIC
jgi:sec-independent protein translocase protein TatC